MAQVTIYLPEDVEKRLRREAKHAGKSLSAYICDLARGPHRSRWPGDFAALFGSWDGRLSPPLDPPPDEIDDL